MTMTSNIGYIVLPPQHMKSSLHNPGKGIFDAETVVPHDYTLDLARASALAKETGDWKPYTKLWTRNITDCLPDQFNCVVLVSAHEVGAATDWVPLGSFVLAYNAWVRNYETIQIPPPDHQECWDDAFTHGATVTDSNADLIREVQLRRKIWTRWEELKRVDSVQSNSE